MKIEIQSNNLKKYYRNEFGKGFYNEIRQKILPLIENAVPIAQIKKDYFLTNKQIAFLIQYEDKKPNFTKILGCKNESYYNSENEIMDSISSYYSYEGLSEDEKIIYNTL